MEITYSSPDLERIARKFAAAPAIIEAELVVAVDEVTQEGLSQIVLRTPTNQSILRGGIHSRLERVNGGARGFVEVAGPGMRYASPVEFGRKPGTMPPVSAIQQWVKEKGLGARTRVVKSGKSAGMEVLVRARTTKAKAAESTRERQIAWAIAMTIKKRGIEGKHMFRDGTAATRPFAEKRFAAAVGRVRKRLGSG